MKNLVLLILALLLVSIMAVHAEGIDLSGMSDEEIIQLYEMVSQEMTDRNLTKSADLQEGDYVIGVDIKQGSYVFSTATDHYSAYYVFKSQDSYDAYSELQTEDSIGVDPELVFKDGPKKVDLKDGQILCVIYGAIHVEESSNPLMP